MKPLTVGIINHQSSFDLGLSPSTGVTGFIPAAGILKQTVSKSKGSVVCFNFA